MSSSPLPVQRWRKLGKCLGPVLGACLLWSGCSLFRHDEQSPAQKLLDEPITHPRHVQAEEAAKPSWLQSWFGPPDPPKQETMGDWVGKPKVAM
jgi:hypothetical protein